MIFAAGAASGQSLYIQGYRDGMSEANKGSYFDYFLLGAAAPPLTLMLSATEPVEVPVHRIKLDEPSYIKGFCDGYTVKARQRRAESMTAGLFFGSALWGFIILIFTIE